MHNEINKQAGKNNYRLNKMRNPKHIIIAAAVFSMFSSNAQINGNKYKRLSQAEVDKLAEITKEKKRQEIAEAENEKSRWIWRLNKEDNEVIWLHSYDRPTECKGNLAAVKTRWQMGSHETIQNLCWYKNEKDKFVTIIDPNAYILGKSKIDASKLIYIQSDKEKREAKELEDNIIFLNNLSDYYARKNKENQEQLKAIQQNLLRPPMLCQDMGGGMSMCN